MIIKHFNTIPLIFMIGLMIILGGCTGLKTFPQAARGGDTIALALGSADGMSRANTTATFVSDADSRPYDITSGIRGIFRLYADKTSSLYAQGSMSGYIVETSGHEPWVTVMVVDLPQGLPLGPGKVHITTTASYPTIGSHINDLPIDLEILPGTGTTSALAYEFGQGSSMPGNLSLLEPQPHAQVIPSFPQNTNWPNYGAIEMKLHVPTTAGIALPPSALRVAVDDLISSPGLSISYRHDANEDLTINLISAAGGLKYYQPRFSVTPLDNNDVTISFTATPTVISVSYYDSDGNPVAGPPASEYSVEMR